MSTAREPVSFIVPAYNCARTISQAVDSIFDGNFDAHDEIILIDDASTDSTPQVLRKIQQQRPSVRLLKHSSNRGTAAASRNTGIEEARHHLVFCLDADNVLAAKSIGPLAEHLLASRADAAAFGELHYFRSSPKRVTHKWIYRERIGLADALAGVVWPGPSGNYMFTRESWRRAGRYHEPSRENRSLDSWTFGIRQLASGSTLVCLPGTWYFHRYGHQSHYLQNWQRGNQSLAGLIALIPFLDLIEPEDVNYIFSPEGRTTWYERLADHPLKLKGDAPGEDGRVEYLPRFKQEERRAHIASVFQKARLHLKRRIS